MSTKAIPIVTAAFAVTILALAGVLLLSHQASAAGATITALQSYDISSPQMTGGVASCPSGSFVSVVPGKN